jgi:hypothetical protein
MLHRSDDGRDRLSAPFGGYRSLFYILTVEHLDADTAAFSCVFRFVNSKKLAFHTSHRYLHLA